MNKTTVIKHTENCNSCNMNKYIIRNFEIIKKYKKEYDTKIHDALSTKKLNPNLNKHLYENSSSFLNVY